MTYKTRNDMGPMLTDCYYLEHKVDSHGLVMKMDLSLDSYEQLDDIVLWLILKCSPWVLLFSNY